jgi:hypothetical protein
LGRVARADHDDRDTEQLRIFPDQGAEPFAAHAGRVEIGNDDVDVFRAMDLERFIMGRGNEKLHVGPV